MSARICQSIWPSSSWFHVVILPDKSNVLTCNAKISSSRKKYPIDCKPYPVKKALQKLRLEVIHLSVLRGSRPANRLDDASVWSMFDWTTAHHGKATESSGRGIVCPCTELTWTCRRVRDWVAGTLKAEFEHHPLCQGPDTGGSRRTAR